MKTTLGSAEGLEDRALENFLGKKIKVEITNSYGAILIPAQTVLNRDHIGLLENHKIDPMFIRFETPVETKNECSQSMKQVVDTSKELFDSMRTSRKLPLMEIRKEVLPVVQELSENTNIFELFQAVKATDEYTYQHNIGVGILSTLIGRWMNLAESEIATLSLAATLHDVGKVKIPLEILNKPEKLTKEEYELVKNHTIFGYEMLKDTTGLNYRVPLVALQHHERNDGKGYPLGAGEDQIEFFSKIVAVADIFHAMSSKRPYHNPIPFQEIVTQMRKGTFGELDPHIVAVFLDNIVKKMVGEQVVLNDGSVGEVVYLNPHHTAAPLIKVHDEFIDLSKRSDLQIMEIKF